MHITLFISGVSGGGAERVTCGLANYLVNMGNHVDIITMSDDAPSYPLSDSINRICLIKKNERRFLLFNQYIRIQRLKNYLINSNTDIYIVMLPVPTIMLLKLKKYTQCPIVVSERNDPNSMPKLQQLYVNKLAERASGYVFQTEEAYNYYSKYIKKIPSAIIPNAVNEEILKNVSEIDYRDKKIVAVGRLTKQKNYDLLIDAFAKISLSYPEYTLQIYGKGPLKEKLEKKISKLGLSNRVLLQGYSNDISSVVKNSSIYVLSSDYEGMPNSLMEAMALGVPCIATDCPVGGPRFLIKNQINGLLIPVNNYVALQEAIAFLLDNPEKATFIGERAKSVGIEFSPENIYHKWALFIEKINSL